MEDSPNTGLEDVRFPMSAFIAMPEPQDDDDDPDEGRAETLDALILAALVSP
jgi:hypothetical protein